MALRQCRPDHKPGEVKAIELISRRVRRSVHKEDAFGRKQKIIYTAFGDRAEVLRQNQTDAGLLGLYIELWSELSLRAGGGISWDKETQLLQWAENEKNEEWVSVECKQQVHKKIGEGVMEELGESGEKIPCGEILIKNKRLVWEKP